MIRIVFFCTVILTLAYGGAYFNFDKHIVLYIYNVM